MTTEPKNCLYLVGATLPQTVFDLLNTAPLALSTLDTRHGLSGFKHVHTKFETKHPPKLGGKADIFWGSVSQSPTHASFLPPEDWDLTEHSLRGQLFLQSAQLDEELFNVTFLPIDEVTLSATDNDGNLVSQLIDFIHNQEDAFLENGEQFDYIFLVCNIYCEEFFSRSHHHNDQFIASLISVAPDLQIEFENAKVAATLGFSGLESQITADIDLEQRRNGDVIQASIYLRNNATLTNLITSHLQELPALCSVLSGYLNAPDDLIDEFPISITPILSCGLDEMGNLNFMISSNSFVNPLPLQANSISMDTAICPVGVRELIIGMLLGSRDPSQFFIGDLDLDSLLSGPMLAEQNSSA
ncbi:MAG: hypothetical protein AAF423_01265 [Pseudomonadota bacterium]